MRRPRLRALVVALVVAAVGIALVGGLLQLRVETSTASFLPSDPAAAGELAAKERDFGGDPVVVVLRGGAPNELVANPDHLLALLKLEGELAKLPDVAAVYGPATTVNTLAGSAQNLLAQIAGRRDGARTEAVATAQRSGASPADAQRAGEAAAAEVSARYGPLVVRALPVGLPTLRNPKFAPAVLFDRAGEPRPQWRDLVPDRSSVAVSVRVRQGLDQAGTTALLERIRGAVDTGKPPIARAEISGVPALTTGLTREVLEELPWVAALIAVVLLARFLVVPTMLSGAGGRRWWPVVATALGGSAALAVFGWLGRPLAFGAVALLPVLLGVGSAFPLYLATARDRRPIIVVALAGAAAFSALGLSPVPFVRELGLVLGLGVVLTVAVDLAVRRWASTVASTVTSVDEAADAQVAPAPERGRPLGPLAHTGLAALAVLGLAGWVALAGLDVRADPRSLAAGLPDLAAAESVERTLGSSGEVGLVLRGPAVTSPGGLRWFREADASVRAAAADGMTTVVGPLQLLGFLGEDATSEQVSGALRLVPSYLSAAVIRSDQGAAVQIYGVKLQDLGAQAAMIDAVRSHLPAPPPGYSAALVGLPVAATDAYRELLGERYVVNVVGILAAGLVLLVGLRRRLDALRAVVAALVATGLGFGAMWLTGIALSPLTLGLGALVTVTAGEFAVVLCAARREGAVVLGRGVALAAGTSCAGFLTLAVSSIAVLREFGLVLAAGVVVSAGVAWAVVRVAGPGEVMWSRKS